MIQFAPLVFLSLYKEKHFLHLSPISSEVKRGQNKFHNIKIDPL